VGDPDPFALHKLLRFPQHGASLGTAQPGPLHVVITGGAYVSIPLTIPDNAHITVCQAQSRISCWHRKWGQQGATKEVAGILSKATKALFRQTLQWKLSSRSWRTASVQ
jgi:hypothetical protein